MPPKPPIDPATLHDARAALDEGVPGAADVVRAAGLANEGRHAEAAAILHTVLPSSNDIRLLFLGFQFFFRIGDHATAETLATRRLEVAQREGQCGGEPGGETPHVARACTNLGLIHLATDRLDSAQQWCERALAIDERLNNVPGVARDLGNLANVFEARREFERAEALNYQALALARQIGDEHLAAGRLANLGDIASTQHQPNRSRELWTLAAEGFERAGDPRLANEYRNRALGASPPPHADQPPTPPHTPHTPHVRLRPTTPEDLHALYEIQLDPAGNDLAGTRPYSREVFMARWEGIFRDPRVTPRVILAGDLLAGSINIFVQEGRDSVGYWLAREHWGRGIATRAIALMLEESPIRPLFAQVAANNTASLRALERNQFELLSRHHAPGTERYLAREVLTLRRER